MIYNRPMKEVCREEKIGFLILYTECASTQYEYGCEVQAGR